MFDEKDVQALKANGFDEVNVSEDGRRMVARKFPKKEGEEKMEPKIIQMADYPIVKKPAESKRSNRTFATTDLAELQADEYTRQAEAKIREISYLEDDLVYYQKKLVKAKKWRKFWRKTAPAQTTAIGLIGLVLGVVLAVSQLLENHGPTVTILGTIGASFIYLASGLFWMGFFGWLGKEQADELVKNCTKKVHLYGNAIEEIEAEIAELQAEADELAKKARHEKYRVWKRRGII